MNETRDAMHLLACYKWVESARNAFAINISPDAKALGRFPTLGVDVDCYTVESNEANADFFGNCPDRFVRWLLRPPLQQLQSKTVVEKSLRRRKDCGLYQAQIILTACCIDCSIDQNRCEVRLASDAAPDNKGGGKLVRKLSSTEKISYDVFSPFSVQLLSV